MHVLEVGPSHDLNAPQAFNAPTTNHGMANSNPTTEDEEAHVLETCLALTNKGVVGTEYGNVNKKERERANSFFWATRKKGFCLLTKPAAS